jgi:hypothetical protein
MMTVVITEEFYRYQVYPSRLTPYVNEINVIISVDLDMIDQLLSMYSAMSKAASVF